MPKSGRWGTSAQSRVLEEYRLQPGCTDESYAAALAEGDASGSCIGSSKLVSAWRTGQSDTMTLGALELLLEHCDLQARLAVADALLRPHGLAAVVVGDDDGSGREGPPVQLCAELARRAAQLCEAAARGPLARDSVRLLVEVERLARVLSRRVGGDLDELDQIAARRQVRTA